MLHQRSRITTVTFDMAYRQLARGVFLKTCSERELRQKSDLAGADGKLFPVGEYDALKLDNFWPSAN